MPEIPTPKDDGLYIPTVGEWSRDKHYYLSRYIHAFTTSMKKKKWTGLHYIDLFGGAGIERLQTSKELDWGSPLIAAYAPHSFDKLHLCEKRTREYSALKSRIGKTRPDSQVLCGDANQKIHEIVREIPQGTLSLAFLDPYGLHLHFDTVKVLSQLRADLIIYFPDHLDALRNWESNYLDDPDSNLDRWMGPSCDWRATLNNAPPRPSRGNPARTLCWADQITRIHAFRISTNIRQRPSTLHLDFLFTFTVCYGIMGTDLPDRTQWTTNTQI